ncbi:MAG: hypothetical protein Q8K64_16010 [Sediminibacterium sp.]|nr:hypothetical protein [Sediminibacterium sp.]TXT33285.1 MAG: hypothetical protein FD136_977 [Chitinophagaceae bacterium]
MQQITIFKIITFILVPVALLFGLMDLIMLMMALSNPALLLIVFAMACFVIYLFASLRFLLQGILNERQCSATLKDWIKVNAYGTLFISSMFLLNSSAAFFINDINLRQVLSDMIDQQPELSGKISLDLFVKMFRVISAIMFVISLLTITHVMLNFKLMKKYAHLFEK